MFGWLRRRSKGSETDNDDREQFLASLKRDLADMDRKRDAQANAISILRAYAAVLAGSTERILDARKLPFPKDVIREAFNTRIRFFEQCCAEEPDNPSWKRDLDLHWSMRMYFSEFQEIDPEDVRAVATANAGRLSDRETLLLIMKYSQRADAEV